MTTETLYVGPLSNATDTDPAGEYGGVPSNPLIVGPEPILSDGSTATYVEMSQQYTIDSSFVLTYSRRDFAKGKLDVLSVDSSRATLNSVRVVLVGDGITWNTATEPAEAVDLYDPTDWSATYGFMTLWQSAGYANPSNSGDTTYLPGDWGSSFRHPDTGLTFTGPEVLDFLASGNAHIRAEEVGNTSTPGTYTNVGRAYEFKVIVDYTLIGNPAPLRLYPRSQTRLYPRRRTRRPGTF